MIDFVEVAPYYLFVPLPKSRKKLQPPSLPARVLSTREAATYLCVSVWTLRELVHRGSLPYLPGRRWRFDIRDLDEFLRISKERLETL
jgi:excisionase family DNA binding protein